jgi:hypothetical protein
MLQQGSHTDVANFIIQPGLGELNPQAHLINSIQVCVCVCVENATYTPTPRTMGTLEAKREFVSIVYTRNATPCFVSVI